MVDTIFDTGNIFLNLSFSRNNQFCVVLVHMGLLHFVDAFQNQALYEQISIAPSLATVNYRNKFENKKVSRVGTNYLFI